MTRRPRVLFAIGTRPEVVKTAPVLRALKNSRLDVRLASTGQHRELLDQMLKDFGLTPAIDLKIMRPGQSPQRVVERVLKKLGPILKKLKPKLVIVQGDTTTAMAAAIAASMQKIPVAHIEAGLRSFDPMNPFPEELNRIVIDELAELHFAPTPGAKQNLIKEGVSAKSIRVTGNTVVDSLRWALKKLGPPTEKRDPYVLLTLHRRESFGAPVQAMLGAVHKLLRKTPRLRIVYPVHPNPAIRRTARRILKHPRAELIAPQGYFDFLNLMRSAKLILTDSGGVVEEAAALSKPVVVLRQVTDRPESIKRGGAILAGVGPDAILKTTAAILRSPQRLRRMARARNPYGDGKAGPRIAKTIVSFASRS